MKKLALALLLLSGTAAADVIHLKNGGKIEGRATEKGDSWVVETDLGTVTLKKDQVARIEKKEWKPKEDKKPAKKREKLDTPYAHPFYAFKLYLPPQWQRGPNSSDKVLCSFYGPKDVAYIPRIDLFIDRNPKELGDIAAAYKEGFKKNYPEVTFPFEGATTIHGKIAYQFCAAFNDAKDPIPYQVLWTIVDAGDRKLTMTYTCTQAWFEKYYSRIDGAMRTIRIYKEPAATKEQKEEFLKQFNLGQVAEKDQKPKDALAAFSRAAELLPEFADIHSKIGFLHAWQKNYADAEAAYRKAIAIEPGDYIYHFNLGACLLQQSKNDEAVKELEKAVELDPDSDSALTNLGVAYLAKDIADKARDVLLKAIEIDPESVPGHYNLGVAYEKLGDKKNAERQFKDTLQLDKNHQGAKDGLQRLKK